MFEYSPWSTTIEKGDEQVKLSSVEVSDFFRGFCAALFFAVPLHFTFEMWVRARVIPCGVVVSIFLSAYLLNVGYHIFSGFKPEKSRRAAWFDAIESMGIGIVASAITMLLIDQVSPQIPTLIVVKLIALQAVPTSFGASLAKNQLGTRKGDKEKEVSEQYSSDFQKITGSVLGAILFSFNIAPTTEPIVISSSLNWIQLGAIVLYSLFISYLMVFLAGFVERGQNSGSIMGNKWAETIIAYVISLIVSVTLLWVFGYVTSETSWTTAIPWVITLGYVTSLGSSAGRLIL